VLVNATVEDAIGPLVSHEHLDARIARWAVRRHGVFSREDAIREGATRRAIRWRLSIERWEELYPGVYRVTGTQDSWRQALLAACLYAGEGTSISHRAGAALWRLAGFDQGILEISVPRGRRVRRLHLAVHEVVRLPPVDVTSVDAIPVTTPTRTLLDLAAVVSADVVEAALDDALRRGLTSIPRLVWRVTELGRRPGTGMVRALLEARTSEPAGPQSVLETRLLRLIKRARLPAPICQHEIKDRGRLLAVVDFAYPEIRLAIEADGYRWHSGRAQWQRDLSRRNALTSRGWRVIHVTSSDLEKRPEQVARTIAEALTCTATRSRRNTSC
jgi:very-short-patch-repair endonuclease